MSAYPIEANFLRTIKIETIVEESPKIKTVIFNDRLCAQAKPGQFVMIWLPGFDEIPMSISSTTAKGSASVTVANVGEATRLLHRKEPGDVIGVRGPFGNNFDPVEGSLLLIGGGTGIAPLAFLSEKLAKQASRATFLLGARTREELLFLSRIKRILQKAGGKVIACTEDGSYGYTGVVTKLAEKTLAEGQFDAIYACGKEAMLLKVFTLAQKHGIPLQASLERLMRCAIGLCGSCAIGRYRVCVDGPVFTGEQLREVRDEFGYFKRDFDGRRIRV